MAAVRILVCGVVGALGVLAFVLGVMAETKRVKKDADFTTSNNSEMCSYQQTPAVGFGVVGALLILLAQIIANFYGGCVCCGDRYRHLRSSAKKISATLWLILSWTFTISSFLLLVIFGSANSSMKHNTKITNGQTECPLPAPGGLAGGAILALVAAILAIKFCLFATTKPGQVLPQYGTGAVATPSPRPSHHVKPYDTNK